MAFLDKICFLFLFQQKSIYPKHWDTLSSYHTCPKKIEIVHSTTVDVFKILLHVWQIV